MLTILAFSQVLISMDIHTYFNIYKILLFYYMKSIRVLGKGSYIKGNPCKNQGMLLKYTKL